MSGNTGQSGSFQVPPPPPGPMSKEMIEKTQRSVFVGNIPYEATEEALVDVFSKAGPVVGFRLVYDRESGKPKGYGFCEYKDYTSAQTALRHLQNIEYNGRPLRIGPAAGELNSAEIALNNPNVGPPVESMYGERSEPRDAPEAISRAVASLPPEQMYELMKQMKLCIQNNPNEARNMLLQNPQLAYALLQAQIVMKIVDPKVAIAMLNRRNEQVPPAMMEQQLQQQQQSQQPQRMMAPGQQMSGPMGGPQTVGPPGHHGSMSGHHGPPPGHHGPPGMNMAMPPPRGGPIGPQPVGPPSMNNSMSLPNQVHRAPGPVPAPVGAPGMRPLDQGPGPVAPPGPPGGGGGHFAVPPPPGRSVGGPTIPVSMAPMNAMASGLSGLLQSGSLLAGRPDEEKAALIMQVLQLSDDQIAMLPEDQRKSIMILKDQVNRGR